MKLIYLSNFFNDHQKPLADEFYRAFGDDYHFVETTEFAADRICLGFKEYSEPYIVKLNDSSRQYVQELIDEADVVICGEAPVKLVSRRYKSGKLTFRDDESRYKNINRYLKWPIYTHQSYYWNKGYLLCASAFGCRDYNLSGMPVDRCFKWGYFPKVKLHDDVESLMDNKDDGNNGISILWAGRLIGWKHPELAVMVAKKLKESGVRFNLEIIGTGYLERKLQNMISAYGLDGSVSLLGAMPPEEVRLHMEKSQIYLFTSDRGEGWGAVLNESMNSACAVVASPRIGSSPYLIEDGKNGLFFNDRDADSLFEKVMWLVEHPDRRRQIGREAYDTIKESWSARTAASNFLALVEALKQGRETPVKSGPCSKAPYLGRNWRK